MVNDRNPSKVTSGEITDDIYLDFDNRIIMKKNLIVQIFNTGYDGNFLEKQTDFVHVHHMSKRIKS